MPAAEASYTATAASGDRPGAIRRRSRQDFRDCLSTLSRRLGLGHRQRGRLHRQVLELAAVRRGAVLELRQPIRDMACSSAGSAVRARLASWNGSAADRKARVRRCRTRHRCGAAVRMPSRIALPVNSCVSICRRSSRKLLRHGVCRLGQQRQERAAVDEARRLDPGDGGEGRRQIVVQHHAASIRCPAGTPGPRMTSGTRMSSS